MYTDVPGGRRVCPSLSSNSRRRSLSGAPQLTPIESPSRRSSLSSTAVSPNRSKALPSITDHTEEWPRPDGCSPAYLSRNGSTGDVTQSPSVSPVRGNGDRSDGSVSPNTKYKVPFPPSESRNDSPYCRRVVTIV
ncbi:hypothetical protein ADEAN_000688300 [Angomonas deanei]|uniref:Uncharacterized protein n=1 Tax=Angomonas deanei TaxID=59799 RepID=A0A7G2CHQ2_9TRYP|nr:hypothetical protein ADEAN_000688300 [Angomonas deanei]